MNKESIAAAYESVKKFSTIMGTLDNPTLDTLDLYNSLGFEELSESISAFENKDAVEVLDGALDEFYIACGKLQVLEALGMNVEEGLRRVCENNLSKFPSIADGCRYLKEYTKTENTEFNVYVIKDNNGKVRKHEDYKAVDLSDLVPKGFFQKGGTT